MGRFGAAARRGLIIVAALFPLVMSGCAVSPEQRAKSAPGAVQASPGEGLLALKITTNRSTTSTFFAKWATLTVRNIDKNESYTLVDRADSSAGHSLFVGALPAGSYSIEAVGNQATGAATITAGADARGFFPAFKVGDGQLTDLGSLVYIRAHYPVNSRQYTWGQVESPLDRQATLRQLDPTLAARLRARPVLGWDEGNQLRARREAFDTARTATMRTLAPTPLADGSLLFGESFGQIAVRSRAGTWRWIQTPTALPIRALHVAGDAVYAGSDDGVLMVGRVGSGSWQPILLPVSDASVLYIGSTPGGDDLLVILETRDRFLGVSTSRAAPSQWTEQFSRPRALFTNSGLDAHGAVLNTGTTLVLLTGSVQAKRESIAYDKSQRAWKANTLDSSGLVSGFAPLSDGGIGGFAGIPLTGMYFSLSRDNGITWERRGELNWASGSLLFVSEKTGYVVRTDSIPVADAEKFELSLWRTDDAGGTWSKVGNAPGIHGKLIALRGTEELAYASQNGRFFVSTDGGKTWRLEREIP